ncbi:MAG: nucleoside monophosphate kinase [Tenericutes bacterium]|nr:nucleoside monophosphate kinase [Bacilli bacterium]MDD3995132.1 nucleoside monophosphate kinase [Bacilli bacterium]NLV90400.1 nucleoside monophosphate kinase [Mycoplasmatota bacterium]
MMNIILIAPPAAGKGTHSATLKEKYGLSHISTGDLLREVAVKDKDIADKIAKGELISDEIVYTLLENKIIEINSSKGHIFDGFPRTLNQAIEVDNILKKFNQKVDVVIYLDIEKDVAMKRVLGRLTCSNCGEIYNIYRDTFINENHCNKCNSILIKRNDDNEETFTKRFNTYLEKTQPLIDFYKNRGLLKNVKCQKTQEETFKLIENIIRELK